MTRLWSWYSAPNCSISKSCSIFHFVRFSATVLGRKIFRMLARVFGFFRISTVLFCKPISGNVVSTSLLSVASMLRLLTRWSCLLTTMWAFPAAMLSSEMSTQSHVSPSSSPMRKEQENARFRHSFSRSSSQQSIAWNSVCESQMSRSCISYFGRVANLAGFFSMSSHFSA